MKNSCWLIGASLLIVQSLCPANPYSMARISRVSAYPPQIEIMIPYLYDTLDVSGYSIYTSGGIATINPGTPIYLDTTEYFVFDSTNTSGFVINPERDSVFLDIQYNSGEPLFYVAEKFGNWGPLSPPINGHETVMKGFFSDHPFYQEWPWFFLTFDFANPDFGWTDIVINEVSAEISWREGADFIELYNQSPEGRSLAGWQIICDTLYDLPPDAYIPGYGFYVIDKCDFPAAFDMDSEADNIYLTSPDSLWIYGGPRLVDQVGWSTDHGENVSFMRYPDGDADSSWEMRDFYGYNDTSSYTFENGFPTRGASNRHDCPGFVVIGAIADSTGEGSARIHWTDPIWDDGFDYSVLVSNDDHFPQTYDDGNIIYQGTNQEFDDSNIPPVGPMFYTVFAHNISGGYSTPTGESQTYIYFNSAGIDERNLPENIGYLNCYPNPFNAQTTISYQLPKQAAVTLEIYDILGQKVRTLVDDLQPAGGYKIVWDASGVSSGIYFARLRAGHMDKSSKMILLK